jgi:hypothetical protein
MEHNKPIGSYTYTMTLSDFGITVTVTSPPASQTYDIPGTQGG